MYCVTVILPNQAGNVAVVCTTRHVLSGGSLFSLFSCSELVGWLCDNYEEILGENYFKERKFCYALKFLF